MNLETVIGVRLGLATGLLHIASNIYFILRAMMPEPPPAAAAVTDSVFAIIWVVTAQMVFADAISPFFRWVRRARYRGLRRRLLRMASDGCEHS